LHKIVIILQHLPVGEEKLAQCGVIIYSFIIRVDFAPLHRHNEEVGREGQACEKAPFIPAAQSLTEASVVRAWHTFMTQGTKPAPVLRL